MKVALFAFGCMGLLMGAIIRTNYFFGITKRTKLPPIKPPAPEIECYRGNDKSRQGGAQPQKRDKHRLNYFRVKRVVNYCNHFTHPKERHLTPGIAHPLRPLMFRAALLRVECMPLLGVFYHVPALLVLLLRAAFGFSETALRASAKQVGIRELANGAMTVPAVVVGHFPG